MKQRKEIPSEIIANKLHEFIDDCDGDMLATLYEFVFANVSEAFYDSGNDKIVIESCGNNVAG